MLKYELKIALRKLLKSKLYSSLNIIGLAIGLSASLIIATIVLNDLSYDKQWKNSNNLFKIIGVESVNHGTEETSSVYSGLGPELKRNFAEVKSFCRMQVRQTKFKFAEAKDAVNISSLLAESTVWDVLDLNIIDGNPKEIKEGIDNVVITQQLKDEYYKNDNPIGKIIYEVSEQGTIKYLITGVIKDIPENTHLRSQVIVLRSYLRGKNPDLNKLVSGQSPASMAQYLLLNANTDAVQFTKKLNAWYKTQSEASVTKTEYYLQPMQDVYLRSKYNDPEGIHGSIDSVYIFSLVAVLILLVACINYVNLSTAKAIERMREAAVSRVVGAEKKDIWLRFLIESLLIFLMALAIGMSTYALAFRFVKQYLGYPLPITLFNSLTLFCASLAIFFVICLITGTYPSYMLSKIKPVEALKGATDKNTPMGVWKKLLIITQFTVALIVLIASITIKLQFKFLKNADPGYNKDNLLQIGFTNWGISADNFKKELLLLPGIQSVTRTNWYPSYAPGLPGYELKDPRNQNDMLHISLVQCDLDFPRTIGLHLKNGRYFDPNTSSDGVEDSSHYSKVLVSDSYANIFKATKLDRPDPDFMNIPIGIIKDFHDESFLVKEKPFIITAYRNLSSYSAMLVRVVPGSENVVVPSIKLLWKRYYPEQVFSSNWVAELLSAEYQKENKLSNIFNIFTILAIFLACLGLFGLVTFTLENRMREICIRKVLGASVVSISALVSADFLTLVIIAIFLSSPIAWYFMNIWLQRYPYRIDVYWWIFIIAAAAILSITMVTLSFKIIKAALANPVKSLRSE